MRIWFEIGYAISLIFIIPTVWRMVRDISRGRTGPDETTGWLIVGVWVGLAICTLSLVFGDVT